jgi:hypothetical protein
MQIIELIAAWVTAVCTGAIALAAWVQLPLISRQVSGLSEQIRLSRVAEENADRRTRESEENAKRRTWEWETLKACNQYDTDPILEGAMLRIYNGSERGKNYRNTAVDHRDMIIVLNYLSGLATGIKQDLYIEDIIKDHMAIVVRKHVTDLIESGIVSKDGYHTLLTLHNRWSQEDINYQSGRGSLERT